MLGMMLMVAFSCNSNDLMDDPNAPTAELKLYLIDTAKIKSVKPDGTAEKILVNCQLDSSSSIATLCFNNEGSKIVYVDSQASIWPASKNSIRSVNSDGTADQQIYLVDGLNIRMVKVTSDNKIFAVQSDWQYGNVKYLTMNLDGSALQVATGSNVYSDVTKDKKYGITYPGMGLDPTKMRIIDLAGDNRGGSLYMQFGFPVQPHKGSFSNDGKYAIIPFKDGTDLKLRMVDIAAKTFTDKIIRSNYSSTWAHLFARLSNDSKKLVYTIAGDAPKSETVIVNLADNSTTSFFNNDDNIFEVYPY